MTKRVLFGENGGVFRQVQAAMMNSQTNLTLRVSQKSMNSHEISMFFLIVIYVPLVHN